MRVFLLYPIFFFTLVFTFPDNLRLGNVSFLLNDKKVQFFQKAKAVFQKTDKNKWKVTIGFKERKSPINFFITFTVPESVIKAKTPITTKYHDVKFIYRSVDGDYLADKKYIYFPGDTHSSSVAELRKSQKIATGVGAIENYKSNGTEFVLQLEPVYKNGVMVELVGTFFGKVRFSDKSKTEIVSLENGEFRAEVVY
jgi:hypothetical protein